MKETFKMKQTIAMNEEYTYGLLTEDAASIPLTGVKVTGDIFGRSARVKLQQTFTNRESKPVEAVYKFPLPEGAAICSFEARIDSRLITGAIEEREKAFEHYDEALAQGDGAYLLDEERPNIFTLSVGNLNPGASVLIEIEYVTLLEMEGPKVRFYLPTTISPRYIPADQPEEDGMPEDAKLHPPYADEVPYGLTLLLNVHNPGHLKRIESPTHPVSVSMNDKPYQVSFSSEEVKMDRDFILYLESKDTSLMRAYRHITNGETFIQLDLLILKEKLKKDAEDVTELQDTPAEIVFLIDCSGSMQGDSIQEAKKALGIFLKGLSPGTYFNIWRFGSTHESLFQRSVKYSDDNLNKALSYLDRMQADLGGTEIFAPLEAIYSQVMPVEGDLPKDIILLTDGEIGNEEQVLDLARRHPPVRVFPVGIGAGPNEFFIRSLARNSRGACEFIFPGERIEPKVLLLFPKIREQTLTDFEIRWGGQYVEQAPAMPFFFFDRPQTVFARVKAKNRSNNEITVRGNIEGVAKEWTVRVENVESETVPIPTLWARERIRDLEENRDLLDRNGSQQRMRKTKHRNEMIVNLSKTYEVLSRSTSFVAVEDREEEDKTKGELVLRKIPVMVTAGWHGIRSRGVLSMAYKASGPFLSESVMFGISDEDATASFPGISFGIGRTMYERSEKPRRDPKTDIVLSILALQKADGGLELSPEVASLLNLEIKEIRSLAKEIEVKKETDTFLLLSTAILIRILETRYAAARSIWEGVVRKSRRWLADAIAHSKPTLHGKDLETWIEEFLRDTS